MTGCGYIWYSSGALSSCGFYGSYKNEVLADSPAGYWRLGETTGTTAVDLSSQAHNGTYIGGYILDIPGPLQNDTDKAVKFDGVSGTINMTSPTLVSGLISIEAWVYFESLPYTNQRGMNNEGIFRFLAGDTSGTNFAIRYATSITPWAAGTFASNTPLTTGTWYHLVAVYNGASWVLYVNGQADGTKAETGTIASGGNLYIASRLGAMFFFNGRMDEVAIYDTALSATRIRAHYNTAFCR